jgi:hypothetical protein
MAWRAICLFVEGRVAYRRGRLGTGSSQVRSHLAPGTITSSNHQVPSPASPRRLSFSPPSLRAQVSTARRVCGRVGIALRAAAPSAADRPARSRDRYDLLVASNPEALDGPITPARHPMRARVLAVDRGGPRPRWRRATRCRRYTWPEPHPRRQPQMPEHPPHPPA